MNNENYIQTDAFCLRIFKSGAGSARIDLFTREMGKVSVFQKGFYSSKKQSPSLFDTGQELSITFLKKGEFFYLHESSLKQSYGLSEYKIFVISSFIFELLNNIGIQSAEESKMVYQELKLWLQILSGGASLFNSMIYFEYYLLRMEGLIGDETLCNGCDIRMEGKSMFAEPGSWNFFCKSCSTENSGFNTFELSPEEMGIFQFWKTNSVETAMKQFFKRASVIKIQTHFNSIIAEICHLKTLPQVMQVMEQRQS